MMDTKNTNGTDVHSKESDYVGFSRFEIELEFVQCLANPMYLHEIYNRNYFEQDEFVNYLKYLQYFKEPKYAKYLYYPGTTLRSLELLQQKTFRDRLGDINFCMHVVGEWIKATSEGRPAT